MGLDQPVQYNQNMQSMLPVKFIHLLEIIIYIGYKGSSHPVSNKELCHYKRVPSRHFEVYLQALTQAGILKGNRGAKGGYTLATEKRKITLAEIYKVYQCKIAPVKENNAFSNRSIKALVRELEVTLLKKLQKLTLYELCETEEKMNLSKKEDFMI